MSLQSDNKIADRQESSLVTNVFAKNAPGIKNDKSSHLKLLINMYKLVLILSIRGNRL